MLSPDITGIANDPWVSGVQRFASGAGLSDLAGSLIPEHNSEPSTMITDAVTQEEAPEQDEKSLFWTKGLWVGVLDRIGRSSYTVTKS